MHHRDLERLSRTVRFTDWIGAQNHEQDVLELGDKAARHIHYENRSRGRFIVGLSRVEVAA